MRVLYQMNDSGKHYFKDQKKIPGEAPGDLFTGKNPV